MESSASDTAIAIRSTVPPRQAADAPTAVPDRAREQRARDADGKRDPPGEHHAHEEVAPESVGAEEMEAA